MLRGDDISKKEKMQAHQGLAPLFHAMVDKCAGEACRKKLTDRGKVRREFVT
jgi:hypothetical protein